MANFNTHITYAAAASGLLSVLCLQIGLISQNEALMLALTGTIGGILPDIDLQRSYPSQLLFSMFGLITAFSLVFLYENTLTITELWLLGFAAFFAVRYPIWSLFHHFTRHRGSIHSLLVAFLSAFITVIIAHYLFEANTLVAWFFGLFMFYGFIIHLLLDELYSVDFTNRRIKRSFGTAMKVVDSRDPAKMFFLIAVTGMAWWFTPEAGVFWGTISSGETYQIIADRFTPDYVNEPVKHLLEKL